MKTDNRIKRVLSHPNTLTLFRVVAVPIVVILMIYPNRAFTAMAAFLFSAAAITDYLDGYLARRRGLETTLGKVMDPVADKLLVSSALLVQAFYNVRLADRGFDESDLLAMLDRAGQHYDRKTVATSMRRQNLRAKAAKKFKATTNSQHDLPVAPNRLQQDFTATAPNQKYVSDITK